MRDRVRDRNYRVRDRTHDYRPPPTDRRRTDPVLPGRRLFML